MIKGETDLKNEYYVWLCVSIKANRDARTTYRELTKDLFNKNFTWFVPNDDNRAFEAKNLREKFCEELNLEFDYDYWDYPASMLELIIALAYRCENLMADTADEKEMSDWFWMLMGNVGLDLYTDRDYDYCSESISVDEILDRIINRKYQRDGRGGLFPMRKDTKDQRKVELWYQMNTYLVENYY